MGNMAKGFPLCLLCFVRVEWVKDVSPEACGVLPPLAFFGFCFPVVSRPCRLRVRFFVKGEKGRDTRKNREVRSRQPLNSSR